jgi:rubrerythrin
MNERHERHDRPDPIETIEELLAHALELEHESAARYAQLADSMEVHHNRLTAEQFRHLAALSDEHAVLVEQRAAGHELPRIPPWEYKWHCPGSPETDCLDEAEPHYLMTRVEALKLALHNERRAQAFYAQAAVDTGDTQVRELATEMAAEEAEHIAMLEGWLAQADGEAPRQHDPDPPNVPA